MGAVCGTACQHGGTLILMTAVICTVGAGLIAIALRRALYWGFLVLLLVGLAGGALAIAGADVTGLLLALPEVGLALAFGTIGLAARQHRAAQRGH
jgi:hypothetical protein